jgi:hypothetical protein
MGLIRDPNEEIHEADVRIGGKTGMSMPPSSRARNLVALGALLALCAPGFALADEVASSASEAHAATNNGFNNGEDPTRPRNQFQVRQRYERLPDAGGRKPEKWVTTLRADLWTRLGDGWKLYGRVDLPLVYSNDVTSSFNPNGHGRFGQGDLLTEIAIVAPPPTARLGYGLGVRAVWPTAGLNEAGKGKYQIGPVVGARYSLPEISPGSFFLAKAIYLNSVASRDENSGRTDINLLKLQPKFNVGLPDHWFVTAYASETIEINYQDDGKVFVPFDLMIGKKFFDSFVASLEYSRSMFHDKGYEPYQWQLEARIGYYF